MKLIKLSKGYFAKVNDDFIEGKHYYFGHGYAIREEVNKEIEWRKHVTCEKCLHSFNASLPEHALD